MKISVFLIVLSSATIGLYAAALANDEAANDQYVDAAEIYAKPNTSIGIKALMGRRVKLEVVVEIARAVPVVNIVQPGGDVAKNTISAHILSMGSAPGEWKHDQRLIITGIVVDQGYNAYMIYLHKAESPK